MAPSEGELQGKIALITGSSRGIGAACAIIMAREGADVVVNHRDSQDDAVAVAERIHGFGQRALVIQADVSDARKVADMVGRVIDAWGRIDILVNNVGRHATHRYAIESMDLGEWHESLKVNLTSHLLCIQAVVPGMLERRWGRIVNIGSIVAQRGSGSGDAFYVVTKAGVHGLTPAVFHQLASRGIAVNTVSPGVIDTPMTRRVLSAQELQVRAQAIPVGRIARAEEVAKWSPSWPRNVRPS